MEGKMSRCARHDGGEGCGWSEEEAIGMIEERGGRYEVRVPAMMQDRKGEDVGVTTLRDGVQCW